MPVPHLARSSSLPVPVDAYTPSHHDDGHNTSNPGSPCLVYTGHLRWGKEQQATFTCLHTGWTAIRHDTLVLFNWLRILQYFILYLPVLLECCGYICRTCSWVPAHTGHLAGNISLLVLEEHTGQNAGRRRNPFHRHDHGHRPPTARCTHLQPNSGKRVQIW